MDILNNIIDYLLSKETLYASVVIGAFTGEAEEICFRTDPSDPVVSRYMDGSESGEQYFSVLCKSASQLTAMNAAEQIKNALDFKNEIELTAAATVTITPSSAPLFVSKSDANEYVYSAAFKLEYYIQK